VCETMELVCLGAPRGGVCPSLIQTLGHLLHPPHSLDRAFVNIHTMLLNSAELCVHHEVPGFTRPQISKSVVGLTNLFILKCKSFLTLFSIFPRNAGGDELGKMVFPSPINIFPIISY